MSWSVSFQGTPVEARAEINKQFDSVQNNYPVGTAEGDDVVMCRTRLLKLLEVADLPAQVKVSANGSHGWSNDKEHPSMASFSVSLAAVAKT